MLFKEKYKKITFSPIVAKNSSIPRCDFQLPHADLPLYYIPVLPYISL